MKLFQNLLIYLLQVAFKRKVTIGEESTMQQFKKGALIPGKGWIKLITSKQ
jgi:hypothetical protein